MWRVDFVNKTVCLADFHQIEAFCLWRICRYSNQVCVVMSTEVTCVPCKHVPMITFCSWVRLDNFDLKLFRKEKTVECFFLSLLPVRSNLLDSLLCNFIARRLFMILSQFIFCQWWVLNPVCWQRWFAESDLFLTSFNFLYKFGFNLLSQKLLNVNWWLRLSILDFETQRIIRSTLVLRDVHYY